MRYAPGYTAQPVKVSVVRVVGVYCEGRGALSRGTRLRARRERALHLRSRRLVRSARLLERMAKWTVQALLAAFAVGGCATVLGIENVPEASGKDGGEDSQSDADDTQSDPSDASTSSDAGCAPVDFTSRTGVSCGSGTCSTGSTCCTPDAGSPQCTNEATTETCQSALLVCESKAQCAAGDCCSNIELSSFTEVTCDYAASAPRELSAFCMADCAGTVPLCRSNADCAAPLYCRLLALSTPLVRSLSIGVCRP